MDQSSSSGASPSSPGVQAPRGVVACAFCATLNRVDLTKLAQRPRCANCQRPILLDRPIPATAATLDKMLTGTTVPVLVDFYADWCGPCKMVSPLLDELAKANPGKVTVLKIDVDKNEDLAKRFEVSSIPNLLKYQDGKQVDSMVGALPKEQLDAWVLGAAKP